MRRRQSRFLIVLIEIGAIGALGASCSTKDNGSIGDDAGMDGGGDATAITDATHERTPYDGTMPPGVPRTAVGSQTTSTRVDVESLLFAAGEMQISGEPFASGFAGRNLGGYDRNKLPSDQYILSPTSDDPKPLIDLFGFSTAVESYEYSKYYMNIVFQESTAGVSLAEGPLVASLAGTTSVDRLRSHMFQLLSTAGTDVGGYATLPAPANNNQNYLGFPGVWPSFAPFKSFDPAMVPTLNVVQSCTFSGGYGGIGSGVNLSPLYECAYNSTHLTDREAQVDKTIVPSVLGMATWKEALWAIDFAGRLHDSGSNQINTVAPTDLVHVGERNNSVLATDPAGALVGTYIGSSPLEGMWGLVMISAMENAAEWLVSSLMTSNGTTLGGFATKAAATAYDYTSPLAWFPAAVHVTENTGIGPFPAVTSLSITDATSRSADLSALLLGNAMFFGMTDPRNAGLGQRIGLRATFDGAPFSADDGVANGEETPHDRALAVLRVAFVDLDRMHADPALGVFVDTATVTAGTVTRSSTVTTTAVAHAIIALRQTLLSLNGSITQYGAPDPDPAADAKGILNTSPIHPPGADAGAPPTFSARVRQVFTTNALFVRDVLTKPDGTVANTATIVNGVATPSVGATTLENQAAAIRALTEGFLVTGDVTLRDRARAVARRLEARFYSVAARMYRGVDGGPDEVHMNADRFAWLQSALRETYKSLHLAGDAPIDRVVLEDRIARANKLFLNGWDDINGDQILDTPAECLAGRLQMAEQALTGELGRDDLNRPVADRDQDCVIELAHAKVASVMAGEVFFHSP